MGLFPTPGLFGSQQRQTLTQAQDKIQAVFIGGLRSSTGEAALGTKAPQVGERVEAGEQGPRGGGGGARGSWRRHRGQLTPTASTCLISMSSPHARA